MKKFEEIKTYIVDFAKSKNACSVELNRAKSATNIDELLQVVKDNISWTIQNSLFNAITMEEYFGKEKMVEFDLANTGVDNIGFSNTGDRNTGDWNTGDWNTGDRNTGDRNTGDRNTGYWNTGDRNTGYSNTGDRNTGDRNTGDRNTGDWNTGDRNTGYSNTGDRNTGVFCTGEPETIKMFDKPSNWTTQDFTNSKAFRLMRECVDTKMWVYSEIMTTEEKEAYPSHKTAGGYLKNIEFKEAFKNAWHNWNAENKQAFTSLPNFNAEIFETITGVKI